jgi:hypothetical protein
MLFLVRAVFWTVIVATFVPGAFADIGSATGAPGLERLKNDAIGRLVRVRAELDLQDLRAPQGVSPD